MYKKEIKEKLDKQLGKLNKRNPELIKALDKKIEEILQNPEHYKPLKWPMENKRRVHIGKHVLVFEINEADETVVFLKFEHHDNAYL